MASQANLEVKGQGCGGLEMNFGSSSKHEVIKHQQMNLKLGWYVCPHQSFIRC